MDATQKAQIAARIDRLLGTLEGDDKKVNTECAKVLGVSTEAVRQWRKGVALPKLENIFGLAEYLTAVAASTSPEYLLFGLQKGLPSMELRERIADEGEELELLRLFRSTNRKGQETILANARALQLSFPRASNVQTLHSKKKKQR